MVIESKTNTIIQNKTFLDSIFKLEEKLNNRILFLSEFNKELSELYKKFPYYIRIVDTLHLFYDSYYDKLKVVPSQLDCTLDIKNAIYVDKFRSTLFLTKNNNVIYNSEDLVKAFNLVFPESKIENVILKLKFKCLNNETNSIQDFVLDKQFNYEDIYPYYLNDKYIKLLLSIKGNQQSEIISLLSEINFLDFDSKITSFFYLLKHLKSTEIFYRSNIEIDFYDTYIKYLIDNNQEDLFSFLTVINAEEFLLALRSLILLLKKNKEIFDKIKIDSINEYHYLYILSNKLSLFKRIYVDQANFITVKEFKLIFPDYILDDIFSNQIKIKYIFYDYKTKKFYYDFESYNNILPLCYKLDFSDIIVLNVETFMYFDNKKNKLTDYFKKNISKEKIINNIIIPIKTGSNTLLVKEEDVFIKLLQEEYFNNKFNLFPFSRNSDLVNIYTLILFDKYIDYNKIFSNLTFHKFEQLVLQLKNIVKTTTTLEYITKQYIKKEKAIVNSDIDELIFQYYLYRLKENTTQSEFINILIRLRNVHSLDIFEHKDIIINLLDEINIDKIFEEKKDWNEINKKDFDDLNKYPFFLCLKKKYGFFKSLKYTIKLFNQNK